MRDETRDAAIHDQIALTRAPKILATFRDNGNLRWMRFPSGRLRRLSNDMGEAGLCHVWAMTV
jgi:hypothetical protein